MPRYDTFLSHASTDKPAVEYLARKLREAGVEPFLDKWHLVPGEAWQEALEEALDESRTCAVFIGKEWGSWQHEEMRSALDTRVKDGGFRVIPVLLPGGKKPGQEELPRFLLRLTWVDFRAGLDDEDAFRRFLAGIQGKAPGPGAGDGGGEKPPLPLYRCMAPARESFVQRSEYAKVRDSLLAGSSTRTTTVGITTAIHGAGGFGKTALAIELCHDVQVRAQYSDGVLWVTMGEEMEPAGRLARVRDLIRWWSDEDPPAFETVSAASAHLRQDLDGKRVLLVVDDVWRPEDVTPFHGLGPTAALLVTTRDSRTLPADSVSIQVDAMEVPEAVRLLGAGLPAEAKVDLRALAKRLGEWPLLLKIVNRQLRELVQDDGLSLELSLREVDEALDAEGLTVFDHEDLESRSQAVAHTVGASLRRLSSEEVGQFQQLAIFPEDKDIPLQVLEKLWGSRPFAAKKLCGRLHDLSLLLRFDRPAATIRLHDVIRAFLLQRSEGALLEIHRRLLDVLSPASRRWADMPLSEGYLWKHLGHHLVGCGESAKFRNLLGDFEFLSAKLAATEINTLLADYRLVPPDREIRLIEGALRLSAHVLIKRPEQLREQLWGRLQNQTEKGIQNLLERAAKSNGRLWLRPRSVRLARPGGSLIRTIEHPGWPTALAVLDERRAVSGSFNGALRLWDIESGLLVKEIGRHGAWVRTMAVWDDSQRVIAGFSDGTLCVWDIETGEVLQLFGRHSDGILSLQILDSRRVALGADQSLRILDIESGRTASVLEGQPGWIRAVAMLSQNQIIAGSDDGVLRVLNWETGETTRTIQTQGAGITSISPLNTERVLFGCTDGSLQVWDLAAGQPVQKLNIHSRAINTVLCLNPRTAISASADWTLRIIDLDNKKPPQLLEGHSNWVSAAAVIDPATILSASADRTLRLWSLDAEHKRGGGISEGHSDWVRSIVVLDDRRALSGADDGTIRLWDLHSGQALRVFQDDPEGVRVLVALDSRRIISGSNEGSIHVWDLEEERILQVLSGHSSGIRALSLLSSRLLVSGASDGTLLLWDLETGSIVRSAQRQSSGLRTAVALNPRQVICGFANESFWKWDVEQDQIEPITEKFVMGDGALAALDGERFVSGSVDGTLRLWNLHKMQPLRVFPGHTAWVRTLARLDDRRVIAGSFDRTLVVWDMETGEALSRFFLDASVTAISVSPNGKTAIAGDAAGQIHLFDLA